MKLSIIIPVYNEENYIEQVISEVRNALPDLNLKKEIIIVDDCSNDKTGKILNRFKNVRDFKIISLPDNKGKGYAIRKGFQRATGDIILIQDADLEYSVRDYPALLKPLLENKADIVYGSRFKGKIEDMKWQNFLANKILTLMTNILYGLNITDLLTAYKLFRREKIKSIKFKSKRFEFCPEITAKLAKRGFKIVEVPISYKARDFKSGKKIKYRDGIICFWTLIKYRFAK